MLSMLKKSDQAQASLAPAWHPNFRNQDRLPDVIVGNKKGVFVFLHQARKVSQEEWRKAQPRPYVAVKN